MLPLVLRGAGKSGGPYVVLYITTSFAFALPVQVWHHLTGAAGLSGGFIVTTDKSDSTSLDCLLLLDFGHGVWIP